MADSRRAEIPVTADEPLPELAELRTVIDDCDAQLIRAIHSRFSAVEQVGRLKREAGVPVLQPQRREQVMQRYRELGADAALSSEFVERLALLVLEEAHRVEELIVGRPPSP